jgi:galactose-1-phosphate uridylyltransferase
MGNGVLNPTKRHTSQAELVTEGQSSRLGQTTAESTKHIKNENLYVMWFESLIAAVGSSITHTPERAKAQALTITNSSILSRVADQPCSHSD